MKRILSPLKAQKLSSAKGRGIYSDCNLIINMILLEIFEYQFWGKNTIFHALITFCL